MEEVIFGELHANGRIMITLLEHIGISSFFCDLAPVWADHLRNCLKFPSKIKFGINNANSVPSFSFKGNDIRLLFVNPLNIISCQKCCLWDKKFPKIFQMLQNILLHYVQKVCPVFTWPAKNITEEMINHFPVASLLFKKKGVLMFGDSFGTATISNMVDVMPYFVQRMHSIGSSVGEASEGMIEATHAIMNISYKQTAKDGGKISNYLSSDLKSKGITRFQDTEKRKIDSMISMFCSFYFGQEINEETTERNTQTREKSQKSKEKKKNEKRADPLKLKNEPIP